MNLSDSIARYIRVGVTLAVGFLVTWLATSLHIVIGPSSQAALVALTYGVVSAAYYALARYVEKRWPAIGKYLLGAPVSAMVELPVSAVAPLPVPTPATNPAAPRLPTTPSP